MVNGIFVDMEKIAEEAGCSVASAYMVSARLVEALHQSALVNGLSGSLWEAFMRIDAEAAYHLGGLYREIGGGDTGHVVNESLIRCLPSEDWVPYRKKMEAWEETLTEDQKAIVRMVREQE